MLLSCSGIRRVPQLDAYQSQAGKPDGSLRKNQQGIWELYVSGNPLERGLTNGQLTRELLEKQEAAFLSNVQQWIPSRFRQRLLQGFIKFFGRSLDEHIPEEYLAEIYGISRSSADTYHSIAPAYPRLLYFHAAHDIGHALQDLALVGCSSFAAWGDQTADGKLLIGRNFDFYAGDEFSEDKIVAFVNPDSGYKHAFVTWAGMIGAVSGMNEHGLTVTINAGRSNVPFRAKTPISLLTREILQYATTIEEAIRIAAQRPVFVSESILVGSAADGQAALIEVSPRKFGVHTAEPGSNLVVCTNHFQSDAYRTDKKNLRQMEESHSRYRFNRMHELLGAGQPLTPPEAAAVLRDRDGLDGVGLGHGNEKAINQLLAHHAVIFQPADRLMWVSANPYQLGEFVAYDLDEVFRRMEDPQSDPDGTAAPADLASTALNIPADPFAGSVDFENYQAFRTLRREVKAAIKDRTPLSPDTLERFAGLNPAFWETHFLMGEYYFHRREYAEALPHYRSAAALEVTTLADQRQLEKRIRKCIKKSKQ